MWEADGKSKHITNQKTEAINDFVNKENLSDRKATDNFNVFSYFFLFEIQVWFDLLLDILSGLDKVCFLLRL